MDMAEMDKLEQDTGNIGEVRLYWYSLPPAVEPGVSCNSVQP